MNTLVPHDINYKIIVHLLTVVGKKIKNNAFILQVKYKNLNLHGDYHLFRNYSGDL